MRFYSVIKLSKVFYHFLLHFNCTTHFFLPVDFGVSLHQRLGSGLVGPRGDHHGHGGRVRIRDSGRPRRKTSHAGKDRSVRRRSRRHLRIKIEQKLFYRNLTKKKSFVEIFLAVDAYNNYDTYIWKLNRKDSLKKGKKFCRFFSTPENLSCYSQMPGIFSERIW